MVRLCGAVLGLLAFGVTLLLGLAAGNPSEVTLVRAVWAMLIFCTLGLSAGWVAHRVLDEHALRRSKELLGGVEEPEPDSGESGETGVTESESGEQPGAGANPATAGQ